MGISGSYFDEIPEVVSIPPGAQLLGGTGNVLFRADLSLLGGLKAWAYSEAFAVISATRNADNVITSANIKWPDGTSGVFTSTTINSTFNTIDAWSATYLGATTKTITQSAVTRNVDGAVTAQPEITIA